MEIWKAIIGYEGFYEISNKGRVRSLDRTVYFRNNKGKRKYIGKIIKPKYRNGYQFVNLYKNKHCKTCSVHRLVALHFIPNPNNYELINHKDGIKSNNKVENLEWCDYAYNYKHAIENRLTTININGLLKHNDLNKKNVVCIKDNKIIQCSDCSRSMAKWFIEQSLITTATFDSIARAVRKHSDLNKTYHRYNFIRTTKDIDIKNQIIIRNEKQVIKILPTSKECATWLLKHKLIDNVSIDTAARNIRKSINNKKYKNYYFQKLQ